MTRRSDILKIFAVAAVLALVLYYLAHYGLHLPSEIEPAPKDAPASTAPQQHRWG
jgi:hypothetical protein